MTTAPAARIRRLPASDAAAPLQLAAGQALLAGLEEQPVPALRWYRIMPAALVLGSAQRLDEIDPAACAAAGLTLHKRSSGGGVVLADEHLLSLDLTIPREHALYSPDVTESYRWMGAVWQQALATLLQQRELTAAMVAVADARADRAGLDALTKRVCFAGLSPFEVTVAGRKVVGLAQMRRRQGTLMQAGIYLRWQPRQTAALLAASPQEREALAGRLAQRVAGLAELLGELPRQAAVKQAFEQALKAHAGLAPYDDEWRPGELEAHEAALQRYEALAGEGVRPAVS